uniref:Uncharacterized protein n=1 Tax=Arion vulgaris TaxID=1028688 RepID=A0A0B6YQ35_9EUPU
MDTNSEVFLKQKHDTLCITKKTAETSTEINMKCIKHLLLTTVVKCLGGHTFVLRSECCEFESKLFCSQVIFFKRSLGLLPELQSSCFVQLMTDNNSAERDQTILGKSQCNEENPSTLA